MGDEQRTYLLERLQWHLDAAKRIAMTLAAAGEGDPG